MSKENPKGPVTALYFELKREPLERVNPRQSNKTGKVIDSQGPRVSFMKIERDFETIYREFLVDPFAGGKQVITVNKDGVTYQRREQKADIDGVVKEFRVTEQYTSDKGILNFYNTEKVDVTSGKVYEGEQTLISVDTGNIYQKISYIIDPNTDTSIHTSDDSYNVITGNPSLFIQRWYDKETQNMTKREERRFDEKIVEVERKTIEYDPSNEKLIHSIIEKFNNAGILERVENVYDPETHNVSSQTISKFHNETHQLERKTEIEYFKSKPKKMCKRVDKIYDAESIDEGEYLLRKVTETYDTPDDNIPNLIEEIVFDKDSHEPVTKTIQKYDPIERKLYREKVALYFDPDSNSASLVPLAAETFFDEILDESVIYEYNTKYELIKTSVEKYKSGTFKNGIIRTIEDGEVITFSLYTDEPRHSQIVINTIEE